MSETERKLQADWDNGGSKLFPRLKSIAVSAPSGRGLRGIRNLSIGFEYPVTFLSGQNGCGKSTLLSLAALAFHGVEGHIPSNSRRRAGEGAEEFGYYTFQDFFYRGPGDADVAGVQIRWEFTGVAPVTISKQSDKWMRYERRPARPVEFLGLSRAVPAIELPTLRNHFALATNPQVAQLTQGARDFLERILRRSYPGAAVLNGRRYAIRRSGQGQGSYTSFNMGTGEDALMGLLARLEAVPIGALVVIEELETGLHPAAQRRAAGALVEIALARRLQIIGSTHSHHVLDQLPRQARVLVVRDGETHRIVQSPSTQLALSEMAETSECELLVLCEDQFAVLLLRQMLPNALRRRISIRSCGAKSELALQAQSYLRLNERARCLVIWDGDVTPESAENFVRAARARFPLEGAEGRLRWARLPGDTCPESWALNVVRLHGVQEARNLLNCGSDEEALGVLSACGFGDPHAVVHDLAQRAGLPEETAANVLVVCASRVAGVACQAIAAEVEAALEGRTTTA